MNLLGDTVQPIRMMEPLPCRGGGGPLRTAHPSAANISGVIAKHQALCCSFQVSAAV